MSKNWENASSGGCEKVQRLFDMFIFQSQVIGIISAIIIVSTSNLRVTCTILNRKATLRVDWY
jgi:hypothetical protein